MNSITITLSQDDLNTLSALLDAGVKALGLNAVKPAAALPTRLSTTTAQAGQSLEFSMTIFAKSEACSSCAFPLQGWGNPNPEAIRRDALSRYGLDVVGALYEQYFERLLHLWDDGWYEGKTPDFDVEMGREPAIL